MGPPNVVILDRGEYTTCAVNLHGATVVSWRIKNQENIFVSKLSEFNGKSPVRGGISLAFPHVGQWSFGLAHGFARIMQWNIVKCPGTLPNGDVEAIFSLEDNLFSRAMWNYNFRIVYRLVLCEFELHSYITIYNTSHYLTFRFTMLLHTHFLVPDVRYCKITGLKGCRYIDKTKNNKRCKQINDTVTIRECTDNVYKDTAQSHIITNLANDCEMRIKKRNLPDLIIYNPWKENTKTIRDMADEEYLTMACVESGNLGRLVFLKPGATIEVNQILQVCKMCKKCTRFGDANTLVNLCNTDD